MMAGRGRIRRRRRGRCHASVQGLSDSFQALKTFGDPGIVKALAVIGTKGGKTD